MTKNNSNKPTKSKSDIAITVYAGARNPVPYQQETDCDWAEVVGLLRQMAETEHADKLELWAFGPHRLTKPRRHASNVEAVTLLVIDVDRGDMADTVAKLKAFEVAAVVYGSPSDSDDLADDARRYRVVVPVTSPIPPERCQDTRYRLAEALGIKPGQGVEGAHDAAKLFFCGRLAGTPAREFIPLEGDPQPWEDLPECSLDWSAASKKPAGTNSPAAGPGKVSDRTEAVVRLIKDTWHEGDRHDLCRALGSWLASKHWRDEAIKAVIGHDDLDPGDVSREYRVTQAIQAADRRRDGEDTIGWQYLEQRLGALAPALEPLGMSWKRKSKAGAGERDADGYGPATPSDEINDGTPGINCDSNIDRIISAIADPAVMVFQRTGQLVQVVKEARTEEQQREEGTRVVVRPRGTPTIRGIPTARLGEIIRVTLGYPVPRSQVLEVEARGEWYDIRPLDAIASYPVLRRDGTVLTRSGYDAPTRTLAHITIDVDLPEQPTQDDARAALTELSELISDFPFGSDAQRAAWLAMLLTIPARPAIDGPTPLGLLDATMRGSGKTLLADLIALIVTGAPASRRVAPKTKEEWDKTMLSILMAGDPFVLLDNVKNMVVSDALDAVLTGTVYSQRLLGVSEDRRVPIRTVFMVSANNARLSTDLVRRSLQCRLEPTAENPEARTDFRIADIVQHTRANRVRYLRCALIVLRAYAVAGRPAVSTRAMGSYPSWSKVVRDAIVWAGAEDPATTQDALRESADIENEEQRTLLTAWHELLGDRVVTVSELISAAEGQMPREADGSKRSKGVRSSADTLAPALREAIDGVCPGNGIVTSHTLGNRLRVMRGVIIGGLALKAGPRDRRTKTATWQVVNGG